MIVILVLGCNITFDIKTLKYIPDIILETRLNRAILAYQDCTDDETILVVSGGRTKGRKISESSVMKDYLVNHGINETVIFEENRSVNTIENCIYSYMHIQKIRKNKISIQTIKGLNTNNNYYGGTPEESGELSTLSEIKLVTSEFHMDRSMRIFKYFLPWIVITTHSAVTPQYHYKLAIANEKRIDIEKILDNYTFIGNSNRLES